MVFPTFHRITAAQAPLACHPKLGIALAVEYRPDFFAGCRMSLAGNPTRITNAPAQCTQTTQKLFVRCCSNSGAKVQMATYGCNKDKTYEQAQAICSAKALRLCTQAEIMAGKKQVSKENQFRTNTKIFSHHQQDKILEG